MGHSTEGLTESIEANAPLRQYGKRVGAAGQWLAARAPASGSSAGCSAACLHASIAGECSIVAATNAPTQASEPHAKTARWRRPCIRVGGARCVCERHCRVCGRCRCFCVPASGVAAFVRAAWLLVRRRSLLVRGGVAAPRARCRCIDAFSSGSALCASVRRTIFMPSAISLDSIWAGRTAVATTALQRFAASP